MDPLDRFTSHLKNVLTRALVLVVEMGSETITPAHLLWAISTEKDSLGADILTKAGIEIDDLRILAGAPKDPNQLPGSNAARATPLLSDDAKRAIEKAMLAANLHEHAFVGTEHVLYGLLRINDPSVSTFFTTNTSKMKAIDARLSIVFQSLKQTDQEKKKTAEQQPCDDCGQVHEKDEHEKSALDFFGTELTSADQVAKTDSLSGREQEIERLAAILTRRTKNNPLLLGEAGVGKTAIIEGLAKMIANKTAPASLHGKRIFQLDMGSLLAGAMYRGDFEARLTDILDDVKELGGNAILFIDEIHTVIGAGAGGGALDASNMLKPALARGELRLIGATTPAEYKKCIEPDPAFSRRFAPMSIQELSAQETLKLLKTAAKNYGDHHGVLYSDDVLETIVMIAEKHMHSRHFPDKAIDLLDEVGAHAAKKLAKASQKEMIRVKKEALEKIRTEKKQAVEKENFSDAEKYKAEEKAAQEDLAASERAAKNLHEITTDDVRATASAMLNIPLQNLSNNERETLQALEVNLQKTIIGQDHVITIVAQALKRARLGLQHHDRPHASFLFAGPSGVGKTELAKAITKECFTDKKQLLKLDMSEYGESFAVSKLIGSPAGYIGYKEGAKLTDFLKNKPHSVILFDEFEKAHKDVQALLLQLLEDGQITDATGNTINARNAIIILTTNIGRELFTGKSLGLETTGSPTPQAIRSALEEHFRPELLNRLDTICAFQDLKPETVTKIIEKEMLELKKRLKNRGIEIQIEKNVARALSGMSNKNLGARDIQRALLEHVEYPIANALLAKKATTKVVATTDSKGNIKIKAY